MIGLGIQLIYGIIFIWYCKQKLNVVPRFKDMPFYMVKEILGFSIYVFASSIIDMLYWATDKVLIGAVLGTVAVAVYNIGGTFYFNVTKHVICNQRSFWNKSKYDGFWKSANGKIIRIIN